MEPPKQLLTIARLALEAIICVCLTTLYQCEFQDITTLYPLSIGILFYCYNTNKERDE